MVGMSMLDAFKEKRNTDWVFLLSFDERSFVGCELLVDVVE
jgi:hypothetical protein